MIATTGQKARISRSVIAGQPRSVSVVDVVSIDGDLLTYTTDGVWFSEARRSAITDWEVVVRVVIDGADHYGTIEHEGPVVAIVGTPEGRALVTVLELDRWNDRLSVCPLHGADCEAWA